MAPRRPRDTRADAERSFEQLYRGHRRDVYRAALRELGNVHDAEDVTQAAFVDAYRAVLRGTRPHAPRAWLLTIAENVRRRRFGASLRRPREEPLLDADAVLAAEESNEQAGALLDALATLTTEQREAFLLREIAGRSYDEIARHMGTTVASVQMLLFRARKTLRDELEPPRAYGAFVPLVSLFSRFEALGLRPRAVGAVGASLLAVGVSATVPPKADPQPVKSAEPRLAANVPALVPVASARPVRPVRAARPAVGERRVETAAPVRVATQAASPPAVAASAPPLDPARPQPEAAPPSLKPLAAPGLGVPLVEPLLERAGAAGAAGAGATPLPELPLDSLAASYRDERSIELEAIDAPILSRCTFPGC